MIYCRNSVASTTEDEDVTTATEGEIKSISTICPLNIISPSRKELMICIEYYAKNQNKAHSHHSHTSASTRGIQCTLNGETVKANVVEGESNSGGKEQLTKGEGGNHNCILVNLNREMGRLSVLDGTFSGSTAGLSVTIPVNACVTGFGSQCNGNIYLLGDGDNLRSRVSTLDLIHRLDVDRRVLIAIAQDRPRQGRMG